MLIFGDVSLLSFKVNCHNLGAFYQCTYLVMKVSYFVFVLMEVDSDWQRTFVYVVQ